MPTSPQRPSSSEADGREQGESAFPSAGPAGSRSLTRKEFDEVIRRAAEIAVSEPEGAVVP